VKIQYPDAVMIFILPPTQRELAERMNGRGRDDAEAAKERLDLAGREIAAAWQHYEHMVINDNLEHAIDEVVQIIEDSFGE
jgi:guanylate kinase